MLYAYMNKCYSSRDIETACHRDINFMYLLEDSPAPDHATIARFRTHHFAPNAKRIMAQGSGFLHGLGEISGETVFINGTKIEANYLFPEDNQQTAFIRPSNYEISKTRKYKTDINRRENMAYDEGQDIYICKNERQLKATGIKRSKPKTGYVSEKTCYSCEDCKDCHYKTSCIRGDNSKIPMKAAGCE